MGLFGDKKPQAKSVTMQMMKDPPVEAQGLNGNDDLRPTQVAKGGMDVGGAFQYFVMSALWEPVGYGKNGVVLSLQNVKDNGLTIWTQAFPVGNSGEADALYSTWVDAYAAKGGFSFSSDDRKTYGANTWKEQQGVSPDDDRHVVIFASLVKNGYLYLVIGEARRPVMRNGLSRNMQPFLNSSLRI